MSQYTELIQIVDLISIDAENAVIGTLEYADQLGRFNSMFSSTVNGTSDLSAKKYL